MSHYNNDPGQGDLNAIATFADLQRTRNESLGTLKNELMTLANSVGSRGWVSSAADSWVQRVRNTYPQFDAGTSLPLEWAAAADSYKASLEGLQSRAQAANHTIFNANQVLNGLAHVPPDLVTPALQAKIQEYEDERSYAYNRLGTIAIERSYVDAAFASVLRRQRAVGEVSNWSGLASLYTGATTADDIIEARKKLIADNLDLVHGIGDLQSVEDLTAFLAAAANDPALSSQFWLAVGGDGTARLLLNGLDAIEGMAGYDDGSEEGFDSVATGVDFARAIRDSLSAGSSAWDETTAKDFASQLWSGADWPGNADSQGIHRQAVGFLFDDAEHSPMSQNFTVAMADLIDASERTPGGPAAPSADDLYSVDPEGNSISRIASADHDARATAAGVENSENHGWLSVVDPMGRVLDTLGTYPDAAWDWLSADGGTLATGSPASPEDKVAYWSSRDWEADGWDGFGSLWEGSMHARGGIASADYSPSTWSEQNDVANRIIEGLSASNGDLRGETLSEGGGNSLGLALGNLLPLVEAQLFLNESVHGEPFYSEQIAGMDEGRMISPFDANNFGDLFGAVAATDSGFANLRTATTNIENNLLIDAQAVGGYELWDRSIGRIVNIEAVFSGSVGGEEIMQARFDDEVIRQKMGVAELALAFMPGVGGAGAAVTIVNVGLGAAGSGILGEFTDAMATNEAMARDLAALGAECGTASIASKLAHIANNEAYSLNDVNTSGLTQEQWLKTFEGQFAPIYKGKLWDGTDAT